MFSAPSIEPGVETRAEACEDDPDESIEGAKDMVDRTAVLSTHALRHARPFRPPGTARRPK
jgi:hypothetical protein